MENNNTQRVGTTARNNRTMNRKGPFIRFDIAMLNSLDMTLVRQKYGIEGWGIVLYIMKCLLERHTDCRAPLSIVPEIAYVCHKSKRTILQLICDFPALFEIEPDGQTFTSPYLLQLFVKCSAKNEKSNRSLNKLTNETIDNQPVNVPKNNEQEQEQKKTTKRVEKVDDDDVGKLIKRETETKHSNTSPNPFWYLPQPLRRRGAQIACKLGIPPNIATDIPDNTCTKMACTPNIPPNIATNVSSNTGMQATYTLKIPPFAATNESANTDTKAACTLDAPRCIHGEGRRYATFARPASSGSLPLGGSGWVFEGSG